MIPNFIKAEPTIDKLDLIKQSVMKAMSTPRQTAVDKVPMKDYAAGLTRPELSAVPEDQQFKASYNPASALLVALGLSQQRENNIKAENQKASLQEYGMKLKNAQDLNQHQELNRIKKEDPDYQLEKESKLLDLEKKRYDAKNYPTFQDLKMRQLEALVNKANRSGTGSGKSGVAQVSSITPGQLLAAGINPGIVAVWDKLPGKVQLSHLQKAKPQQTPEAMIATKAATAGAIKKAEMEAVLSSIPGGEAPAAAPAQAPSVPVATAPQVPATPPVVIGSDTVAPQPTREKTVEEKVNELFDMEW